MNIKFTIIALLVLITTSCAQRPNVPSITIEEFIEKIETDTSLVILDVRTPQELVGPLGKIESVINIPVQELSDRVSELEKYKGKNIAVICRTGNRSTFATKILIENGHEAENVLDGMVKYRKIKGK
ncbi:MAG: rhodanese-like domain-containing protein [Ignavibacteriales bacterium]|jgi:rhodanese-related sulfurtransferase|nr:MAG: rhodanese-like domain-containing protein [Ignavibacteriales bacterium]